MLVSDADPTSEDLINEVDAGYFMDQFTIVQETLEVLAITCEIIDAESDLQELLDMCTPSKRSLKNFSALKRLAIPQAFLFGTSPDVGVHSEDLCQPSVSIMRTVHDVKHHTDSLLLSHLGSANGLRITRDTVSTRGGRTMGAGIYSQEPGR